MSASTAGWGKEGEGDCNPMPKSYRLMGEMSTKVKNVAKHRPFGLKKCNNEKFLAQLLSMDISYVPSDE